MRNICSIQKGLIGKTKREREKILKSEVETMSENEKERYKRFYEKASLELRTRSTVSIVVRIMDRAGLFFQSQSYFPLEYALSCLVTGNPIREPGKIIEETRKSRPHVTKNAHIPPVFERGRLTIDLDKGKRQAERKRYEDEY